MAGVKVTDLTTLGTAASDDVMYIVDTSTNTSKQIEVGNVVNLQTAYDNGSTINGSNVIIEDSTGADIVAIGELAADSNTGTGIVAIGNQAGSGNTGDNLVALGLGAGLNNTANNLVALGLGAGVSNTGLNLIAIGKSAAYDNTGLNVIALGNAAANNNTLSGMFVISNSCMPSYADATAAATAITLALGASPSCYYLYHDQSDDTIKAVIPV
jgi:hypothetical protein